MKHLQMKVIIGVEFGNDKHVMKYQLDRAFTELDLEKDDLYNYFANKNKDELLKLAKEEFEKLIRKALERHRLKISNRKGKL